MSNVPFPTHLMLMINVAYRKAPKKEQKLLNLKRRSLNIPIIPMKQKIPEVIKMLVSDTKPNLNKIDVKNGTNGGK